VIRIHLTPADLARVRFAAHPVPVQEMNAALIMLTSPRHAPLLFGRWRSRAMRTLPATASPLRDLVPARHAPAFLDSVDASLDACFEGMRASDPAWVSGELELAYASAAGKAPTWIRELHRGAHEAWQPVFRAGRAAFDALLAPVWPLVQDLHRAEFARYAAATARFGIGHALTLAVPGSRLIDGVWEFGGTDADPGREVRPDGRGLLLLPTFHWTGGPLVSDIPGRIVTVTFPAGPGIPLPPSAGITSEDALADVLGRTRLRILMLSADGSNTSGLARGLGLSAATVSAHTAALRAAGLITSVRDGKAVIHRRSALGDLLLGVRHDPR
jgi:DNA-binding transcriptional ArsR family regulator